MAKRCPVLIFASGQSVRMKQPKAFLKINNMTWIQHRVSTLKNMDFSEVFIVTNDNLFSDIRESCPDAHVILNHSHLLGPFSSIQLGCINIHKTCNANQIFITPLDIPTADSIVWSNLELAISGDIQASMPEFNGKKGHPVCISNAISEIICARGLQDENARLDTILRSIPNSNKKICKVSDEKILLNINTPEDWAAYLTNYAS